MLPSQHDRRIRGELRYLGRATRRRYGIYGDQCIRKGCSLLVILPQAQRKGGVMTIGLSADSMQHLPGVVLDYLMVKGHSVKEYAALAFSSATRVRASRSCQTRFREFGQRSA